MWGILCEASPTFNQSKLNCCNWSGGEEPGRDSGERPDSSASQWLLVHSHWLRHSHTGRSWDCSCYPFWLLKQGRQHSEGCQWYLWSPSAPLPSSSCRPGSLNLSNRPFAGLPIRVTQSFTKVRELLKMCHFLKAISSNNSRRECLDHKK